MLITIITIMTLTMIVISNNNNYNDKILVILLRNVLLASLINRTMFFGICN